jgi:hypothetical protein
MKDKSICYLLIRKLRNWDFKELHSKKLRDKDRRNGRMKLMTEKEEENKRKNSLSLNFKE